MWRDTVPYHMYKAEVFVRAVYGKSSTPGGHLTCNESCQRSTKIFEFLYAYQSIGLSDTKVHSAHVLAAAIASGRNYAHSLGDEYYSSRNRASTYFKVWV